MKKKNISLTSGFIRWTRVELNWSLYEWAMPISFDFTAPKNVFIRVLFAELIIQYRL
jgi:hypothetical protein